MIVWPEFKIVLDLVGGFNPSEKYESIGMIFPNIWQLKMFQATNQRYIEMLKPRNLR